MEQEYDIQDMGKDKTIIKEYVYTKDNLEHIVKLYNDKTGSDEYYHPKTKMRVRLNFPLISDYEVMRDVHIMLVNIGIDNHYKKEGIIRYTVNLDKKTFNTIDNEIERVKMRESQFVKELYGEEI